MPCNFPRFRPVLRRARRAVCHPLRRRRDEQGSTLVIVMLLVTVLAAVGPIMVSQVNGDSGLLLQSIQQRAALEAADAGIQWYVNHLNTDPTYYQSSGNDPAVGTGNWCTSGNSACGLPQSSPPEAFHYTPNTSTLYSLQGASAGELLLTVTGRSGVPGNYSYATLLAGFRRSSILGNAYFSNYELLDPNVVRSYADAGDPDYQVKVTSGFTTNYQSVFGQNVSYGSATNVSLWSAACLYYTYQPNAFIDSLGNVPTGLSSPKYYSSSYPYYGPFYGPYQGSPSYSSPAGPTSFSYAQGSQTMTVPDTVCSQPFQFISSDQFAGPVYSQDQLHICGNPTFQGQPVSYTSGASSSTQYAYALPGSVQVTSSNSGTGQPYPSEPYTYYAPGGFIGDSQCSNNPVFAYGANRNPLLNGTESMPQTNTQLKSLAASNGCVYTGPTMIELVTVSGSTTMNVWSPLSTTSATSSVCSTGKNASGQTLRAFSSSTPFIRGIPLPAKGVLYVDDAAAGSSGVTVPDCVDSNDASTSNSQSCTVGIAYVEGELSGQLTIAAASDVIVTRDVTLACASGSGPANKANPVSIAGCSGVPTPDVLGLDAGQDVILARPNNGSSCSYDGTGAPPSQTDSQPGAIWPNCNIANPIVDAAIIATQGSFGVQSYDQGSADGSAYMNGADVSDYRGPFGTFSGGSIVTGYAKAFAFDNRLAYLTPPGMLNLSGASWQDVSLTLCGNADTETVSSPSCPAIP